MEFSSNEWLRLTPLDRAKKSREMAVDAQQLAEAADGAIKLLYLDIARKWLVLANELEQASDGPGWINLRH